MKLRIEIDSNLEETEIVIKAAALTDGFTAPLARVQVSSVDFLQGDG